VSLAALITAAVMSTLTHSYYNKLASSYYGDDGDGSNDAEVYQALASTRSFSVIFAGLYTMILAAFLSCFGGMCVVGFVSPTGRYIAPFLTGNENKNVSPKHLGIFLGALVLFSNLCLVSAVVLGEFQVGSNYLDERQKEELGYFAIERTANVLGIMSMFLAVINAIYSMMLFAMKDVLIGTDDKNGSNWRYVAPTGNMV